jgi:hypothetical protein
MSHRKAAMQLQLAEENLHKANEAVKIAETAGGDTMTLHDAHNRVLMAEIRLGRVKGQRQ